MELSRDQVIDLLNRIVELESAGAVRYTQYSLMVFGHARIPIMDWMREQAAESLLHATQAGRRGLSCRGPRHALCAGAQARTIPPSWRPPAGSAHGDADRRQ